MADKPTRQDYNRRTAVMEKQLESYNNAQKDFKSREDKRARSNLVNNIMPSAPSSIRSLGIVGIILLFLIIATFFRISSNLPNPSFQSLLELIQDSPIINISLTIPSISAGSEWGIFEFLKNFINGLISITNFGLWLVTSIIEVLSLIFYFLGWLLGISV